MPQFENVTFSYKTEDFGNFPQKPLLDRFSMSIPEGAITVITGPSGCGKTSTLKLLAGILQPISGNVRRETENISYLPQEALLLPWRTAVENVNLVLSDTKKTLSDATLWLERVELGQAGALYPDELSGGMAQRVALARTLAANADLLLFDEPCRGMDRALHERMLDLIAVQCVGKTAVIVSHDPTDLRIANYSVTFHGSSPNIVRVSLPGCLPSSMPRD